MSSELDNMKSTAQEQAEWELLGAREDLALLERRSRGTDHDFSRIFEARLRVESIEDRLRLL